jgi:hypothetical protein
MLYWIGLSGIIRIMMSAGQYKEAIRRLALTQKSAAEFLGVSYITSRRWAAGLAPVHPTVATLLTLMLAMKLTPEKVKEWIDE